MVQMRGTAIVWGFYTRPNSITHSEHYFSLFGQRVTSKCDGEKQIPGQQD